MSEMEVRIVELRPGKVAAAHGFGPSPEGIAIGMLMEWAKAKGLLEDPSGRRFFGFNNPDPSPGSPNYGYEQWMTVDETVEGGESVEIKDLPGGRYAVAHCKGVENIYPTWQALVAWQEETGLQMGHHACLEELLTPQAFFPGAGEPDLGQLEFDLYHPIVG
jgi:DNA gyrase inhibitor GyrI